VPARDRIDYSAWLKGLSVDAQWFGRQWLAHTIPGDRQAWRDYLEVLAAFNRLDRASTTPQQLGDAHAHLTKLLTAVRGRWR
jgi:heme oxygenase